MTYTLKYRIELDGQTASGTALGDTPRPPLPGEPGFDPNDPWGLKWKQEQACIQAGEKASADLGAKTLDLSANWKPDGFYSPEDIKKVITQTHAVLTGAGAALDQILNDRFDVKDTARDLRMAITRRFGDSIPFVQAMNAALNNNIRVVDAPGLKRWVIKSMNEAQVAYEYVAYLACVKPFLLTLVASGYAAFEALASVAKVMTRVVVAAGEAIIKVPDTLDTLWTIAKWGGLAYGVLYLAASLRKHQG